MSALRAEQMFLEEIEDDDAALQALIDRASQLQPEREKPKPKKVVSPQTHNAYLLSDYQTFPLESDSIEVQA